MTSADLDHNDKLLAAGKKEKLEWVTPKISLMLSQDTLGTKSDTNYESLRMRIMRCFLTNYTSNPATPTKSSQRKGSAKTLF